MELIGQRIDKYDVLEEVGHGGMAVVYRGLDRDLDREVAVKVLHAHLADRGESRKRLHREAITVARLRHPNIVEIYDYANPDAGKSYIVTEFIHGETLRAWIEDRWQPRPLLAALVILRLCRALDHAHSLGIVHRDIKPENVMIRRDGCLKLMDFGIAQLIDHQKLTMTGQLLGSPAYMAPELINGKPIDARTDIFALGILLYQLATGQLPFNGRNPHEVLSRIANTEFAPASSINPRVDEHIEAIIAKALARDPADRYQSAQALAVELANYVREHGFLPEADDLERFFCDPQNQLAKLDEQLCELFLERGKTAAQAGQSARALRFLSRVLDIEPNHSQALILVTQVQRRGHRLRQMALGAAVLGIGGVVTAGIMLVQRNTSEAAPVMVEARPGLSSPAGQPMRPNLAGAHSRGENLAAVAALPDALTTDEAVSVTRSLRNEALGPLADTSSAPNLATVDPPPPLKADTNDRPTRRPERDNEREPERGEPALEPTQVPCKVRVEGIPVPSRGHYVLTINGEQVLDLPANPQVPLELPVPVQGLHVQLRGAQPKSIDGFEGSMRIRGEDCSTGVPLVLRATVKPARLHFVAKNFPEESLVVRCTSGCGATGGHTKLARDFGTVELPAGTLEQAITLEFKVDGYRRQTQVYRVHPGPNEIAVELEAIVPAQGDGVAPE